MTDPETGAPIVQAVYKRDDVYTGEYLENASELQVGIEDGYRVSWQTTLGGSPPGIVYPNMKKWSGDHGGYDFADTAGVLISNRPLAVREQSASSTSHRASSTTSASGRNGPRWDVVPALRVGRVPDAGVAW